MQLNFKGFTKCNDCAGQWEYMLSTDWTCSVHCPSFPYFLKTGDMSYLLPNLHTNKYWRKSQWTIQRQAAALLYAATKPYHTITFRCAAVVSLVSLGVCSLFCTLKAVHIMFCLIMTIKFYLRGSPEIAILT